MQILIAQHVEALAFQAYDSDKNILGSHTQKVAALINDHVKILEVFSSYKEYRCLAGTERLENTLKSFISVSQEALVNLKEKCSRITPHLRKFLNGNETTSDAYQHILSETSDLECFSSVISACGALDNETDSLFMNILQEKNQYSIELKKLQEVIGDDKNDSPEFSHLKKRVDMLSEREKIMEKLLQTASEVRALCLNNHSYWQIAHQKLSCMPSNTSVRENLQILGDLYTSASHIQFATR